jgi:hypothetical protein
MLPYAEAADERTDAARERERPKLIKREGGEKEKSVNDKSLPRREEAATEQSK